jgi:hypothetical protein
MPTFNETIKKWETLLERLRPVAHPGCSHCSADLYMIQEIIVDLEKLKWDYD